MSRIKDRRNKAVKHRNPMARALRERAFRARTEANRKKYTRKLKHRRRHEPEPSRET